MARNQELVQVEPDDWVSLTNGSVTWVSFQIKNIQYQTDNLILRASATKPDEAELVGWEYKEEEGELTENVASYGSGGQLWARARRGGVAVLVTTG